MSINEKELHQRRLFDKLLDHKYAIAIITILFTSLALLYILLAQNLYQTNAIIEVTPKQNTLSNDQAYQSSATIFERHLQTQIDFLQSRYIISKVVQKLHANINFYQKTALKYVPLEENAPFIIADLKIKDKSFYSKMFEIHQIDDQHFTLKLIKSGTIPAIEKKSSALVHTFSKPIKSSYMEMTIVKNPNVHANKTILYFKVEDPTHYVNYVLDHLSVTKTSEKSSLLEISYSDPNPVKVVKMVNALIHEYVRINRENQVAETDELLKLIREKLKTSKKELKASERRLEEYVRKNQIADFSIQTSTMINRVNEYQQKIEALKHKLKKLREIKSNFKKHYDYKDILSTVYDLGNTSLIKLIESIQEDEKTYKTLRQKYKPKHPDLVHLKESMVKKSLTLSKNINLLLKEKENQIQNLQQYLRQYNATLIQIPQKELIYSKLKREHELIEQNYLFLLDKKTQLTLAKKSQGAYTYTVIDYPFIPERPAKPKKKIILLMGLISGLFLGILYALIREYFTKVIKIPTEVETLSTLPYLGTIPYIKSKRYYNDLFVTKAPAELASQMMWALRATIESYLPAEKECKIIALTSMVKGEGKTTLAANLSVCLGMGDKKTIVISLDFRLPELHRKFGLDNQYGISDALFGNMQLEDVVYHSHTYPNLYVVPSGDNPEAAMRIINSRTFDAMLEALCKDYDYIVLDLPPVGIAAESIYMMKKADLVISVLKANYSEKSFVTYMENIARKNSISNLGFVLNGVQRKYIHIISRKENIKYIKQHQKMVQQGYNYTKE